MADPRLAQRMRELIAERRLSYRRLAARVYLAKSHLHRIAHGVAAPTLDVVQRIDWALGAGGELVSYLHTDQSSRESAELVELLCGGQVEDAINSATANADRLAIQYLSQPPAAVLRDAAEVRRSAMLPSDTFTARADMARRPSSWLPRSTVRDPCLCRTRRR